MKQCISCSYQLKDSAKFCPKCGVEQIEKPQKKFCVQCGSEMEQGDLFCLSCGHEVGKPLHTGPDYQFTRPHIDKKASVIKEILSREYIAAIMWIIVASLQTIVAVIMFTNSWIFNGLDTFFIVVIAVLNFVFGFRTLKLSREGVNDGEELLRRYEGAYCIGVTIYNGILLLVALINGGWLTILISIIGFGASLFQLIGIRNYALQQLR